MTTLYFKVKNEQHSKDIQDAVFALNGGWEMSGTYDISQEYHHLDKPILHIEGAARFDQFGNITEEKFLSLTYEDLNKEKYNIADHVPAHIARMIPDDLSVKTEVTLENFKSHLNKISCKDCL